MVQKCRELAIQFLVRFAHAHLHFPLANQAPDAASISKQCRRDLAAVFDIGKRLGILCAGINQGQGVQLVRQGRHRGGRCAENHMEFFENVFHFGQTLGQRNDADQALSPSSNWLPLLEGVLTFGW